MRVVKSLFVLLVFSVCSAVFTVVSAVAQTPVVPDTCDSEFMEVIEARAWMEGSRELEMAQRLILKPDSVLEYSCFQSRAEDLNSMSGGVFGGGWFSAGVHFSPAFTGIDLLVLNVVPTYIDNNFGHSYGGGTVSGSGCNSLKTVWQALRCHNYDVDKFNTFAEVVGTDPRNKPQQCTAGNRGQLWNAALAAAYPEPKTPPENGGMEAVTNYPALIAETNCSGIEPIETGLVVKLDGQNVNDAVCPAIGCYYTGSTCKASP